MKIIKTSLFLALAVVFSSISMAKAVIVNEKTEAQKVKPCSMSGLSALLYVDLTKLGKTDPSLKNITEEMKQRYGMRLINSELYVGAFADIDYEQRGNAVEYGVLFNGKLKTHFTTVNIPVKRYVDFLNSGIAKYVEIGEKNEPMMDSARIFTNTNQVHQGYNLPKGYTGKGVVVGIVDIGFDYTHRNFYDSTETTYRVKRVWDQNAQTGTAPNGYNYGNLMTTQSQILAARYSHNNQTHGTHVAGMAAGGGTNQSSYKQYKGMAPESDIVLVASTMYSNDILDGLMYILDYADSVGKPCVVNMSLGNHVGPHDGTDFNELYVDYLFEEFYNKGAVLMVSAGNEGSDNIHLSHSYSGRVPAVRTFAVKSNGSNKLSGVVDIWGAVGSSFIVKVGVADSTASVRTLANYTYPLTLNTVDTADWTTNYSLGNGGYVSYYVEDSNYYNGKPHVYLSFNGSGLSDSKCFMISVTPASGTVHMWNNSGIFIGGTASTAGNTNYTTNNKASGNTSIMVASYSTKVSWTTYAGDYYNLNSRYVVGGRSYFSSIGPGLNPNQNKPEIAAPGALINSSYNCYDSRYTTSNAYITGVQTNGTGSCWWGMMQGTSMACPAATGIVALWMEAYPELSYTQVKELLRTTSITDSLTGTIPANGSPYYGWGKINAYAGLQKILSSIPAKPTITPSSDTVICYGQSITIAAPAGYQHYLWSNGDTTQTITVSATGYYSVRVDSVGGFLSPWSDTINVVEQQGFFTAISRDTSICPGQSVNLSISGGTTHLWSNGDTASLITVTPSATTIYTVLSSSANRCDAHDSVTVTVKRKVTSIVSNDTTVCPNQQVILTAGGGNSYQWSDATSQTYTTPSITVTATMPVQRFTVRIDSTGICPAFDTVEIATFTVPQIVISDQTGQTASINGQALIVPSTPAILTVTSTFQHYLWSTGDTTASITVAPAEPTRYSVACTTADGCVDSLWIIAGCSGTAIPTVDGMHFRIYPNPASSQSQLTVECAAIETITIYNMLGKVVDKINVNGAANVDVELKDYAKGVYVISVENAKGQSARQTFVVR